jgi:hypothetical protein
MSLGRWPGIWDHAWCIVDPHETLDGVHKCDPSRHTARAAPIRLKELRFGPQPHDWLLLWERCEEEWVGLFWSLVEAQDREEEKWANLSLPGSWVE